MPRYPDCESCAFYEVEEAVCDECFEGDQWEDADPQDLLCGSSSKRVRESVIHLSKLKKAA